MINNKSDTILIKGKMRKETVLICLSDDSVEENKVRINKGNVLM